MQKSWPLPLKWLFLVLFFYLVIYTSSTQFFTTMILEPLWSSLVPSFAKAVGFEGEMSLRRTGSGDTTYNYFKILMYLIVAIVLGTIVFIVDFKRRHYGKLSDILIVLLRYYLAAQMINYGLAKIFYMQFIFPSEARLDQSLGDFSPMGLLWTFMGYSKGYTIFTGILEFIGGILLLSRHTALLGALTTFGVMLNVMMLNFCYDVPVKLLSSHMVLMALVIVATRSKSLFDFFILNKATDSNRFEDVTPEKYHLTKTIIKWSLLSIYLVVSFMQMTSLKIKRNEQFGRKSSFHFGKFTVEEFEIYDNRDSLLTYYIPGHKEWVYFYQLYSNNAQVTTRDDQRMNFRFDIDTTLQQYTLTSLPDSVEFILDYEKLQYDRIKLHGIYENDSLSFIMKRKSIEDYPLVNRGFNWINEVPYNR